MSHHNSKQTPSTVPQVNPAMNQQMVPNGNVNAGGLFPNSSIPMVAQPSPFMNFPNQQQQPVPMHFTNVQFPNVGVMGGFNQQPNFGQFPMNQFNPAQQQQQQALMQSTIQNIYQLIQLQQNTNNGPQRPPMFQNQMPNVMNPQNPGFLPNQQFNGLPMQNVNPNMGQQLQGNPFLPGSVQMQQNLIAPFPNFQNQMVQGVGPQNPNFPTNQMFGMPNTNGPVQLVNQGQQRFISPMVNTGQTQNPTNFQANNGNVPSSKNGGWAESQHKSFTGHKNNDAPHKGFKSNRHEKYNFGMYNGNMNKEGKNNGAGDSGPRNSTNVEKVFSINYTEQEIKQWREARKKNFPTILKKCTKEDTTDQEAILRRQQLKEVLAKQAELGLEVAEVPSHYLSDPENQNPREKNSYGRDKQNPRWKKHEREPYNKNGKFNNKRGTRFQDKRINKRAKQGHQHAVKRDPSLLQKLLARDVKREKNHLLQVFRFMAVNSFFTGESNKSLKFPSVIVREANPNVPEETTCSVFKDIEKAEEEETTCSVSKDIEKAEEEEDEEEGELTD